MNADPTGYGSTSLVKTEPPNFEDKTVTGPAKRFYSNKCRAKRKLA